MKKILKDNLIIFYAILIFWLPVKVMTGMMEIKFFEKVGFIFGSVTLLFFSFISMLLILIWLKNKSNNFVFINTSLLISFILGAFGVILSVFVDNHQESQMVNLLGLVLSTLFFIIQILIWLVLYILNYKKYN